MGRIEGLAIGLASLGTRAVQYTNEINHHILALNQRVDGLLVMHIRRQNGHRRMHHQFARMRQSPGWHKHRLTTRSQFSDHMLSNKTRTTNDQDAHDHSPID